MTKKPDQSPHMMDLTWPTYAYVRVPVAPLFVSRQASPDGSQDEARYNQFLRYQKVKLEGYYHPPVLKKPWP